jgi:hypothetical protein
MLVIAVRLLEGIFVVGSAGCVVVLILTAIDDLRVLFGHAGERVNTAPSESKAEHGLVSHAG